MARKTALLSVRVPEDLKARIVEGAALQDCSMSDLVEMVLTQYFGRPSPRVYGDKRRGKRA